MSQYVPDELGIMGQGVVTDPSSGNVALQAYGPSGCISIEDQTDYTFSVFDPNTGIVFHQSGDTVSGYMRIESVHSELFLSDGVFKNFPLTSPGDRSLDSYFTNRSLIGALNKLKTVFTTSASPGFTWGRSGTVTSGTYLLNDNVPSNITGRIIFLTNATVKKIFIANEDLAAYTIEVYIHDGAGVNLTLLGSVSVTMASRSHEFTVSYSVAKYKQLALRVGTGAGKNIVAGALIEGTL